MIIFINGSANAGKSTIGKILAEKINSQFLDFDSISEAIPGLSLKKENPKIFKEAVARLKEVNSSGSSVVASYVIDQDEYSYLQKHINGDLRVVTLAPRLEIALQNRGERELSQSEVNRIKQSYQAGIAAPSFGVTIDNSDITPEETVDEIIKQLDL